MLDALSTRSRDGGNVAVVAVDADDIGSDSIGLEAGDNDVSWAAVLGAVAALGRYIRVDSRDWQRM